MKCNRNIYICSFYTFIRDPYGYRYGSIPPLPSSSNEHDYKTISYAGTSPWNSTGFAYTPRYPQSHRGNKKNDTKGKQYSKSLLLDWFNILYLFACLPYSYFYLYISGTASTSVPYSRRYAYDDMYILDPPYHKFIPFYMYHR